MFLLNNSFKNLNNRSTLALLEFFCSHPVRSFYVREVARESGLSVGSCNVFLRKLALMHYLKANRRGNQLYYSLNSLNPIVRQFRIFLNILALSEVVDAVKNRCEKIILYGSRAFGEESENSDFDVFFLTKEVEEVKKIIGEKKFDKISALVVDGKRLIALKSKEKPFYDRIMSGIELWRFYEDGKQ